MVTLKVSDTLYINMEHVSVLKSTPVDISKDKEKWEEEFNAFLKNIQTTGIYPVLKDDDGNDMYMPQHMPYAAGTRQDDKAEAVFRANVERYSRKLVKYITEHIGEMPESAKMEYKCILQNGTVIMLDEDTFMHARGIMDAFIPDGVKGGKA